MFIFRDLEESLLAVLLTVALFTTELSAQERKTRDQLVRDDLQHVLQDGFWIYNDLAKAQSEAARTGKPLLVVIRCIPCEACAQLDSEIVERDPQIQKLLDQYVCLRIVHANGLNLTLFQYDYDQSLAAFLMNADATVYGRYGTRSHQTESHDDVSLEGFAKGLQAGLTLHRNYPNNRDVLADKQSQVTPAFERPELFPSLRDKFKTQLDYEGKVAQSCIHCHQIGEVLREYPRDLGQQLDDSVVFPYPHPKSLGLIMDPNEMATVKRVEPNSLAARAGFQAGDMLQSINGQPMISIADMQWVLHHTLDQGSLDVQLKRGEHVHSLSWQLPSGWRRFDNLSWRATSWALRRMTTGGLLLDSLDDEARRRARLTDGDMALVVKHVGQYGPHALAKAAGFQQGDVIISADGRSDLLRETDLLVHLLKSKDVGDVVPFVVLRDGRRHEFSLRMQQ
jgi:hypothetical protein